MVNSAGFIQVEVKSHFANIEPVKIDAHYADFKAVKN